MRSKIVALGLGSNLENPIQNIRLALHEIKKSRLFEVLKVSSIYESDAQLPEKASIEWNKKFLNSVVLCEVTDSLSAENILNEIKNIEISIGRVAADQWAPRLIDIDILYWSSEDYKSDKIQIPHASLSQRPFALLPLLEVWKDINLDLPDWAREYVEHKPFNTEKSKKYFWPKMVGILNITKDSFSDGGRFLNIDNLQRQHDCLVDQGVDILEIGAESTRPGARQISDEEEYNNLNWALTGIKFAKPVSLDCRKPDVITRVFEAHSISYLNDVTGFSDNKMKSILLQSHVPGFVMHSISVPPTVDRVMDVKNNPCDTLVTWWNSHLSDLTDFGISSDNLIFDPGIGFGKNKLQNLYILRHIEQLSEIKNSIMIGHSRKSFLSLISERKAEHRDLETALVTKDLNLAYVQYLRVHDVETQAIALRVGN